MRNEIRHPDPRWPYGTLLGRLTEPSLAELLTLGTARRVDADETLLREGDQDSHLVLICQGLAKVTVTTGDGRTALLAIRVGGDLVGEMSALNNKPRSATVTTCSPALVRVIHMRQFKPFLAAHPDAAVELAAMVADRLRQSNRHRIDFMSYPVSTRVARIIAAIARTHGRRTPNGLVIDVRLTQPELATICGAAETTVQKALRELRSDGLIDTDYRRITVRDLTGLLAMAQLESDD
ncbi:Crp/Fnr family transcriptional regulator [Micromonospora sp. NPDC003197]